VDEEPHAAERISRQPPPFARGARHLTMLTGSPWSIVAIVVALGAWLAAGWALGFPRGWELGATAGLPVLTLVLLVVVQHTQNHDDRAIQLKLDELIRALDRASNSMIRVDEGSWEDLEQVRQHFQEHVAPATEGRSEGANPAS
jgi:low affinity Fe/Cu permease